MPGWGTPSSPRAGTPGRVARGRECPWATGGPRVLRWGQSSHRHALTAPLHSPAPSTPESLSRISYNAVDGPTDRRSFHGSYAVQDGLPL